MAFVDVKRNVLVLKVVLAGPPAVGKSARLDQIGRVGRVEEYGTSVIGRTKMAVLPIESEGEGRKAEIEIYEWHGPERADVRAKGLFVGLDGLIYMADARPDRYKDTVRQFKYLADTMGKSRLQRLPSLLVLGRMDEGLARLSTFAEDLKDTTWSDRLELSIDDQAAFIEALRVYGEVLLARVV